MARYWLVVCFYLTFVSLVNAQNPSVSDPQATSFAAKSIVALTGDTNVNDVSLIGDATATAGSDVQMGSATLKGKGTGNSRIDLSLSGGNRTAIQIRSGSVPSGLWSTQDSAAKAAAQHNSWNDASWFFPALTSLSGRDASVVLSYVGAETRGGASVQHLRSYNKIAPELSQMDFYLDAVSLLPLATTFYTHADDNVSINIPVEIVYSNYQRSNGLMVPLHIQRYLQGSLTLDINLTSVTVNSGLSDIEFAAQ